MLVASVTLWALLLWLSWTVLLSADPGALLDPHTREHPTLAGRIYYVGYTLFTTGNGDYSPQGALWQTASSLASMSGLFLLTLSVTYLLAVIGAVVGKRSFASQVWTLGHSAEDLVIAAWNGRGFPAVELQLVSLTQQLNTITEQHQAYPMLHYYHEERLPQAASVNLTVNELGVRRRLLMGFLEEELRDGPSPGRYPK